jgi:hypothetical protein
MIDQDLKAGRYGVRPIRRRLTHKFRRGRLYIDLSMLLNHLNIAIQSSKRLCVSCGEQCVLASFTLRYAQKGQPFWTSRRDVAVPGPSQYILLKLLHRNLSRADKVPDTIPNKSTPIAFVKHSYTLNMDFDTRIALQSSKDSVSRCLVW